MLEPQSRVNNPFAMEFPHRCFTIVLAMSMRFHTGILFVDGCPKRHHQVVFTPLFPLAPTCHTTHAPSTSALLHPWQHGPAATRLGAASPPGDPPANHHHTRTRLHHPHQQQGLPQSFIVHPPHPGFSWLLLLLQGMCVMGCHILVHPRGCFVGWGPLVVQLW